MGSAVAWMADGDQVLRDVESPPRRVAEVVGFGGWPLSASLTDASGPLEHLRPDSQKPGMPEVLGIGSVGRGHWSTSNKGVFVAACHSSLVMVSRFRIRVPCSDSSRYNPMFRHSGNLSQLVQRMNVH